MNTRLVTMSASLRTQTVLHCLIIQVLTQESDSLIFDTLLSLLHTVI